MTGVAASYGKQMQADSSSCLLASQSLVFVLSEGEVAAIEVRALCLDPHFWCCQTKDNANHHLVFS